MFLYYGKYADFIISFLKRIFVVSFCSKCGNLSILLTAMGLVFLAVSVLQSDVEVNE